MPTLEFKGKQYIYSHHHSVPFRELLVDNKKSLPASGKTSRHKLTDAETASRHPMIWRGKVYLFINNNSIYCQVLGNVKRINWRNKIIIRIVSYQH